MDSLRTVSEKEVFWLKKDEWNVVAKADSIKGLASALRNAPASSVYFHLNGRNDFASWVEGVFREEALASRLRQVQRTDPEAQKKICGILDGAVSRMLSKAHQSRHNHNNI